MGFLGVFIWNFQRDLCVLLGLDFCWFFFFFFFFGFLLVLKEISMENSEKRGGEEIKKSNGVYFLFFKFRDKIVFLDEIGRF